MDSKRPDQSRLMIDAPGSASHPPRTACARILVVDDDRAILRTMEVNLGARGHDVLLAADGRQALALTASRHPDIVVLDLGLPDLDGLEVIEGLRGWTSVPIIVLSARTAPKPRRSARSTQAPTTT
jgi:two-component system KDP operon response regulator KdpE